MSGFNGIVEAFAARSLTNLVGSDVDPQLAFADKMLQIEIAKLTATMVKDHKADCDDCQAKLSCQDLDDVREYRKELRSSIMSKK